MCILKANACLHPCNDTSQGGSVTKCVLMCLKISIRANTCVFAFLCLLYTHIHII